MKSGVVCVVAVVALLIVAFCTPASSVVVGKPIKAIYIDWHLNWNTPQQTVLDAVNAGFNVIIISFYLSGGTAADMAQAWAALTPAVKNNTIAQAHAQGAVVIVSLGGSTDSPFNKPAYQLGTQVAKWAQTQFLDGVDFDLEGLNQGFTANGMSDSQTVDWLVSVTQGARDALDFRPFANDTKILPNRDSLYFVGPGGVISHAPQGPYFGPVGNTQTWAGKTGGYTSVYQKVGSAITFFNIQFYNQGATCYTEYLFCLNYNGLFVSSGASCPVFPFTAVAEIAAAGVPLSKIVVGKPVTAADASNGWVSGSTLNSFFQQAKSSMVMGWVWNDAATLSSWIHAIYGGSTGGGVNGGSVTGGTTGSGSGSTTTSTTTGNTSGGSGFCKGKADGQYCVDSTHFEWCPQEIVQQCAPGTRCAQKGSYIECD